MILADRINDLALVRKGNRLKRKCNETKNVGSLTEKQVFDFKEKKRKPVAKGAHFLLSNNVLLFKLFDYELDKHGY